MLQTISWAEFFTTITILCGIYYLGAGFLLYRQEIISFFTNGLSSLPKSEPQAGTAEDLFIGPAARPANKDDESNEEMRFAATEKRQAEEEGNFKVKADSDLVGTVSDLGEEIKELSSALKESTKGQVSERFRGLLKKYLKISNTPYRSTINLLISETISEHTAHRIDAREVDTWWHSN